MIYNYNDYDSAFRGVLSEYTESEVCLAEFLDDFKVSGLTINEVTLLFAELHKKVEEDETYIIIEKERKSLIDYLK